MLLTGLGDLPRLALRLSLLYLVLLRGLRLASRGETVRRGLDGERDSFRSAEMSEYGERVLTLPREGERDLD